MFHLLKWLQYYLFLFFYVFFLFYIGDKLKTGEEVADPIKTEIKDEFTMEVPIIDLKSMNKISDGKFLNVYLFFLKVKK